MKPHHKYLVDDLGFEYDESGSWGGLTLEYTEGKECFCLEIKNHNENMIHSPTFVYLMVDENDWMEIEIDETCVVRCVKFCEKDDMVRLLSILGVEI